MPAARVWKGNTSANRGRGPAAKPKPPYEPVPCGYCAAPITKPPATGRPAPKLRFCNIECKKAKGATMIKYNCAGCDKECELPIAQYKARISRQSNLYCGADCHAKNAKRSVLSLESDPRSKEYQSGSYAVRFQR